MNYFRGFSSMSALGNFVSRFCLVLLLAGCATAPPTQPNNLCEVFEEKNGWYRAAAKSSRKWDSPIPVMMAIMHQESRFVADAKPPRRRILGFIPGPRPSDAYGYSQALGSTWDYYEDAVGGWGRDRDDFADAIDFIGWYNRTSNRRTGIGKNDAYHLYLAYHEGHGGFERRSFRNKEWLKRVAKKVSSRSQQYRNQLAICEPNLKKGKGFPWIF
jgi:hypothetical protein